MKILSLLTSIILVLSVLLSCNAFSLPNPIKNYLNELEDQKRDNNNYLNYQNIE